MKATTRSIALWPLVTGGGSGAIWGATYLGGPIENGMDIVKLGLKKKWLVVLENHPSLK